MIVCTIINGLWHVWCALTIKGSVIRVLLKVKCCFHFTPKLATLNLLLSYLYVHFQTRKISPSNWSTRNMRVVCILLCHTSRVVLSMQFWVHHFYLFNCFIYILCLVWQHVYVFTQRHKIDIVSTNYQTCCPCCTFTHAIKNLKFCHMPLNN